MGTSAQARECPRLEAATGESSKLRKESKTLVSTQGARLGGETCTDSRAAVHCDFRGVPSKLADQQPILKGGELAVGVTTAATIWLVTVMGLCFGGGQLGLGLAGFGLGFLLRTVLKKVETRLPRRHSGRLTMNVLPGGPAQAEIAELLIQGGLSFKEPLAMEKPPSVNKNLAGRGMGEGDTTKSICPLSF
jgi:hypothetical protein